MISRKPLSLCSISDVMEIGEKILLCKNTFCRKTVLLFFDAATTPNREILKYVNDFVI